MYKMSDCIGNGRAAMCESCPKGTFMDRDNQEKLCTWCSTCGPGEEVAVNCSVAQDTVCRCAEGLQRDADSGICVPEELGTPDATSVVLVAILILVLTALVLLVVYFIMKQKRFTLKTMVKQSDNTHSNNEHDENLPLVVVQNEHEVTHGVQRRNESSETMQQILENKEKLKAWIGVDPSAFLAHLSGLKLIPRHVHQAAVDKGGEESVEFVLDHFISQGDAGCEKLWDALYSVRKQYVQMWKWTQTHGEALRAIRDKESDLKRWIARDPKHLLLQLMSRGRIPNELFTEAKGIRDGAECTELLLNFFIERGNDDCLKLLFALQAVQDHYPGVKEWLGGLDNTHSNNEHDENLPLVVVQNEHEVTHGVQRSNDESSETMQQIRENKEKLKAWIGVDPSAFLAHLSGLKLIPRHVHQVAVDKGGEESVEFVLDHFISQGDAGCEKLWDALYSVRKQYVQLWKWTQMHGEALRAIRDKESHLKRWIARDPKHLLLQLMSRGQIPNELFTEAKGIRDGAACAELLLNFFIERGNDDCLKLLFALQAVQNEYLGLKEWLGGLDFLRRLSNKSPLVLNKYSDFVLRDKIRFKTRELLVALRDDLTPLLSQLQIRNILTDNSVRAVKEMQVRQGSEKATQHMVELVMARGRPRVKQFWEALWDLRESYPDLENIFGKF